MPLSLSKKIIIVILIIFIIMYILYFIASALKRHIAGLYHLRDCLVFTGGHIADRFLNTIGEIPLRKEKPFTLYVHASNPDDNPFSVLSISNNPAMEQINISLENFKLSNRGRVGINTYITNDSLGFYFDENPSIRYSVNSKKFRTKWNKSIYSNLYKIPDFVPDNLNYSKVSSLISGKNLGRTLTALTFGKASASPMGLINNMRVTRLDKAASGGDRYRISVSAAYVRSIIRSISDTAEDAFFKIPERYIEKLKNLTMASVDNSFVIELAISDNIIRTAETSVKTNKGIYNIKLDNSDDITLKIKNLSGKTEDESLLKLSRGNNNIKLIAADNKGIFISAYLKKTSLSVDAVMSYFDRNNNIKSYTMSVTEDIVFDKIEGDTRNIYSMPLSELFHLIGFLSGEGRLF